MSREYSENVLVQNSAGNLLQNVLGWVRLYRGGVQVLDKQKLQALARGE